MPSEGASEVLRGPHTPVATTPHSLCLPHLSLVVSDGGVGSSLQQDSHAPCMHVASSHMHGRVSLLVLMN